jgi:two-component system, sporulation sensor kinase E
MSDNLIETLLLVNFGLLAFALLAVYYYAYRLKMELKRSNFLRSQSDSYRDLFEETSDVVFQTDADASFKAANRATAKVLGFDRPEALLEAGVNGRQFFAEPAEADIILNQLSQGMPIHNRVVKVRSRKGEFVYLSVTLHAIRDAKGGMTGVYGIGHDVTRRISLEEELWNYSINLERMVQEKAGEIVDLERKKFHLEKLAIVGETVSSLVHELRNPLSTMKMGFLTLRKTVRLNDAESHFLDLVEKEGYRLELMLKDVLDFAKPQELRLIPQDVHPILEQSAERFKEEFEKAGIVFHREFTRAIPRVAVDSERLSQVLVNLVQNAVDAAQGTERRITMRTGYLHDEEAVRIEVADNGAGIAENILPRVFDPFFTGRKTGTGLGLTVVKKIVEAHHGRVGIESRPGKGTTIRIELPALPDRVAPQSADGREMHPVPSGRRNRGK